MSDRKLVMIIDDEADAVDFVASMLSDIEGIDTASASDGESGLAKIIEISPDLIFLDVQMPGKTGFEVFADLKQNDATKEIPVVMLTGVGEKTGMDFSADEMQDFMGSKPDAYIEKPVSPAALQETAKKLLGL